MNNKNNEAGSSSLSHRVASWFSGFNAKQFFLRLLICSMVSQSAFALPGAATWIKGTGTVGTAGSTMTVNVTGADSTKNGTAQVAAINWQGFNIANGETVNFTNNIPLVSGKGLLSIFNFDNSGLMSNLNGTLTSTGGTRASSIYLINPAGVNIGATANINTGGGFVAIAGVGNTFNEGADVILPNGVMPVITLNNAPINIDSAATINHTGMLQQYEADSGLGSLLETHSTGSVTLPYISSSVSNYTGRFDLAKFGTVGTIYNTDNSRLSSIDYVLPDQAKLNVSDSVADGVTNFRFGVGGLAGLGSAVLTNNTIRGNTAADTTLSIQSSRIEPVAANGTGYTESITIDGMTLDNSASTNRKAQFDASNYSGALNITTTDIVGIGNTADSTKRIITGNMARFMPGDSNRDFHGINVGVNIQEKQVYDASNSIVNLITDPFTHSLWDTTGSNPLNMYLDNTSYFNLGFFGGNVDHGVNNLNVFNTVGGNIGGGSSFLANTTTLANIYVHDGSNNVSDVKLFNVDTGGTSMVMYNSTFDTQDLSVKGGQLDIQDSSFTASHGVDVISLNAAGHANLTNVNVAGPSTEILAINNGMTLNNTDISSTGGSIIMTAATGGIHMFDSNAHGANIMTLTSTGGFDMQSMIGSSLQSNTILNLNINAGDINTNDSGSIQTSILNVVNHENAYFGNTPVIANDATLNGSSGAYTFNNAQFKTLTATTGSIYLDNTEALTIKNINNTGTVEVSTLSGDLTVGAFAKVKTTAANDSRAVVLTADKYATSDATGSGGNVRILNNAADAIAVGAGSQWAIFSGAPGSTPLGTLVRDKYRYNTDTSVGDYFWNLDSVNPGNRVYYRNQPVLAFNVDAGTKIYGNLDPAYTYGVSGFIAGDTALSLGLSGTVGRDAGENVGIYDFNLGTLGLTSDLGYTLAIAGTNKFSITPKALTLGAPTVLDKTYNNSTNATVFPIGLTGIVGTDDVAVSIGSANFSDKNVGTNKTVNITGLSLNGTTAGNYTLASNSTTGNASITPKNVTISGTQIDNKTYDGNVSATINTNASIWGYYLSDDLSLNTAGTTATFDNKNAGTGKAVSITGYALAGTDAGNYHLVSGSDSAVADIGKATLTLSGSQVQNRVYDTTVNATLISAGTLSGVVSGDDVSMDSSAATAAFQDKNVGINKTVNIGGLTISGSDMGNYNAPTTSSASATITAANLSVSGTSISDKNYDGSKTATINAYGVFTGVLGSDVVNVDTSAVSAEFADKNAGNGKAVSITGYGKSGADAGNYNLVSTDAATANITPKTLTVSNSSVTNRVYDSTTGATLVSAGALGGVVAGDTVNLTATSAAFQDKNAGTGKTVDITGLAINGSDAGNYVLGSTSTTTLADITKASLGLVGTVAADKVYDATNAATLSNVGNFTGVFAGDTVSIDASGVTASFADKNVGNNKAVSVSGIALSGADAGNYSATATSSATANITPKALTVSGTTISGKVYDGSTTATVNNFATLNGVIAGDTVNINNAGVVANFADKNVGNGKAVSITGYGTTGVDAGNYSLTSTDSSTGNITPKTLTVSSATVAGKTYDSTTVATLTSAGVLNGVVSGDNLSLTASGASFQDKNAGINKTVDVNGLAINGTDSGNYALASTSTTAQATIGKASLSLTGTVANDKVYDGNNSATLSNVGNFTGVFSGDNVSIDASGVTASFADKNAGNGKAVSVNGIGLSGADAGNYNATATSSAVANITPKALTITNTTANDKTYNGNSSATLSNAGNLTGVVSGDTVALTGGTASFTDKNAGINKTVNVSGLGLSGADAGNYTAATTSTTTATINRANMTISAVADTKTVDGTTASNKAPTVAGLVSGDAVNNVSQSFDDSTVGARTLSVNPGYSVADGNAGNNYNVSTVSVAGTIIDVVVPVVPPVIIDTPMAPVVVRTTLITATSDVSSPIMKADTVYVPTGNSATSAPVVDLPILPSTTAPAALQAEPTVIAPSMAPAANDDYLNEQQQN